MDYPTPPQEDLAAINGKIAKLQSEIAKLEEKRNNATRQRQVFACNRLNDDYLDWELDPYTGERLFDKYIHDSINIALSDFDVEVEFDLIKGGYTIVGINDHGVKYHVHKWI